MVTVSDRPATFEFGRFRVVPYRRQLLADGRPVKLGGRTFDLLMALIEASGGVVSKDELLSRIWPDRIVEENRLQGEISALRKAFGADRGLIQTVAGRGYQFTGEIFARPADSSEQNAAGAATAVTPSMTPVSTDLSRSDRPSIAVLPFLNISNDPDQEYFVDGITEDIITVLSKWRWFLVIARNSSFTYKGCAVDVTQIGRELGIRYVVEGSVRKVGTRVRVTAQLIETASGSHLWANNYDCDLIDVFAAQDEVTRKIAAAIEPALARMESQSATRKPPGHLLAWDFFLRGLWHFYQVGEESRTAALECFKRAVELDPELVDAHIGVARTLHGQAIYTAVADRENILREAELAARRALALDGENAYAWYSLAIVQATSRRTAAALESSHRAIELNPNLAFAHFAMAVASVYLGQPETAVAAIDTALHISPTDPQRFAWLATRASALYLMQRYADAIETALQSCALRRFSTASRVLAASYAQLGSEAKATKAITEMLEEGGTERTIADVIRPFLRAADREHYTEGLRKAGLPEA